MLSVLAVALLFVSPAPVNDETAKNPKDFELPCVTDGSTFRLSEHQGKLVVLHFLLKTECPYCLKHTRDYVAESQKDDTVVHLFIKPDSEAELKAWVDHLRLEEQTTSPRILRDANAELATKYRIPDGYKFHGQTVHFPAMIVLDHKGQEQFRYVGKSNADRFPLKKFQTAVEGWKKAAESR